MPELTVPGLFVFSLFAAASAGLRPEMLPRLPQVDSFLYVYDLPSTLRSKAEGLSIDHITHPWTDWYRHDDYFNSFLLGSPARTSDPNKASLYLIPVATGRLYHYLLLNEGLSHQHALEIVRDSLLEAIAFVQASGPYWNQTNGRNHFVVLPLDMGRCHAFAGAAADAYGDLFTLQQQGDLILKDFESSQWFCYRPGRDVLMPAFYESSMGEFETPISPFANERSISVLYRFTRWGREEAVNHSGTNLRAALLDEHERLPIPGAQAGGAEVKQTHLDMQKSILCVCPPGIAQHTLRTYRAITSGCLPVTYTRAFDRPFERVLGLEWERFSLNINPDEHHLTRPLLTELLADSTRLRAMQRSLQSAQRLLWRNPALPEALEGNLLRELSVIAGRAGR